MESWKAKRVVNSRTGRPRSAARSRPSAGPGSAPGRGGCWSPPATGSPCRPPRRSRRQRRHHPARPGLARRAAAAAAARGAAHLAVRRLPRACRCSRSTCSRRAGPTCAAAIPPSTTRSSGWPVSRTAATPRSAPARRRQPERRRVVGEPGQQRQHPAGPVDHDVGELGQRLLLLRGRSRPAASAAPGRGAGAPPRTPRGRRGRRRRRARRRAWCSASAASTRQPLVHAGCPDLEHQPAGLEAQPVPLGGVGRAPAPAGRRPPGRVGQPAGVHRDREALLLDERALGPLRRRAAGAAPPGRPGARGAARAR